MKKIHSTNYFDTFIEVAEDTKRNGSMKPPAKDKKTVAEMQYDYIAGHPYQYTSDDVLFQVFADRNDLTKAEYKEAREQFFSKGQPCFRASPLTKMYGFGIHSNSEGKIALYGMDTEDYQKFLADPKVKKIKAMKSGK
ncbi:MULTISPECIES: DUF6157 family protein [Chryseobacterium]|uniref:Uncharacterized protein n=1 Tax=Chryseobacterium camelliae TaxID=1265445 RepID=A0ABU0TKM3_9FLAO|nr:MULTISPECIES: DUF6157 family protein [Chryseobacterium]MDT3408553.1 hypothetical protein [Pseudacidovorax intermedius]MDQ1097592.1 hypothetical protein [Chryseobacterium camelliae]MDQ1101521.1 hypothetical protein [Chryseobacterium sp. SORGH_AS_1048]MDR6084964.1 hypothetical protein [Chryseobacterium sp. SORGH_AS_0909]MDR6129317.1 hypothetical protein [Chryseobacterium sp. SORGH_AS_1175]